MQRNSFSKKPSRWNEFWHKCASKEFKIESKNKTVLTFKPFLALQGVLALAIVISFFSLAGAILFRVHKIDQTALIKQSTTFKTSPIVSGQPIKWIALVKRSSIDSKKYNLALPKDAKEIKVTTVSKSEAKKTLAFARKNSIAKLTTSERQQLAKVNQTSNNSNNFFAKLTHSLTAALEDAVTNVTETITEQFDSVEQTPEATIVDLSEQITETPVEETPPVATQEVSETSTAETEPVETPVAQEQSTSTEVVTPETENATSTEVIEENPQEEFVQVEFETPAPQITEQTTDQGKQVTVSIENEEQLQTPVTNVLAYANIPEIYKLDQKDKIQLKWLTNNGQQTDFEVFDLNNNGKIDYIEWVVPHLSDQVFEIIFISKAFRLDADQNITEDIYDQTKIQDGNWVTIKNGEYVRATFGKVLDNTKDNTIYAKPNNAGQPVTIEVYPVYTDAQGNTTQGLKVATFENINSENTYRVLLTNLQTPTDVFDLKVSGSVDIDFIVDPVQTLYWVGNNGANTSVATNWKTSNPAGCGSGNSLAAPVAGDTIIFDPDCDNGATIDSALSVATFTIQDGYDGTITQNANVTVSGTYSQVGPGKFTCSDPVNKIFSAGDFDLSGSAYTSSFNRYLGSGSSVNDPLMIRDIYDLQATMNYCSGLYLKLNNNIEASSTSAWRSGKGFYPICNGFGGTFDGDNKTISNLYIVDPTLQRVGLFDSITYGMVKNVGIIGGTITNAHNWGVAGALATSIWAGTIDNCYATTNINCTSDVQEGLMGGLIGLVGGGTVTNSHATGNVDCSNAGGFSDVGGFTGANSDGMIENSYATGNVTTVGGGAAGGFLGSFDSAVINSYSTGNATSSGSGANVGGFAGYGSWVYAVNDYAWGNATGGISAEAVNVGGFIGSMNGGEIHFSYSKGVVTPSLVPGNTGGFVGYNSGDPGIVFESAYYDQTTSGQSGSQPSGVTALATAEMYQPKNYIIGTWDVSSIWNIAEGSYPTLGTGSATFKTATYAIPDDTYNNLIFAPTGAVTFVSNAGLITVNGTLTLNSNSILDLSTNNSLLSANAVSNSGTIQVGLSAITIPSTGSVGNFTFKNTFTIPLAVYGNLSIDASGKTITSGNSSITATALNVNAGVLATSTNGLTVSGDITVNGTISGATAITLNGTSKTITGGDAGSISAPVVLGATRTVAVATGTFPMSGIISDGGSSYGLSKTGAGQLTLSGVNTFTGGLAIKEGIILGTTSNNCFGADSSVITLGDTSGSNSATLKSGALTIANPITVASGSSGTLDISNSGNAIFSGAVTLNNNLTLDPLTNKTLTLSGNISGTGNIIANSTGTTATVTLSGSSVNMTGTITNQGTTTGITTISAVIGSNVTGLTQNSSTSKLLLSGNNSTISDGVTITSGIFELSGTTNLNVSGAFSNSGTFTPNQGTITLTSGSHIISGTNTFYNLTLSANNTVIFPASTTQTISNTLTCAGTAGNLITINSSSANTAATLSKTSGTVSCDYLNLSDSAATGGATWNAGINSTIGTGITGWRTDYASPTLSSFSPTTNTRINTESPNVIVTISEAGDCRASKDATHITYASMSGDVDCTGDGTISASCQMSGLTDTSNSVYIICQDTAGNSSATSHLVYTQPYIGTEGGGVAAPSPVTPIIETVTPEALNNSSTSTPTLTPIPVVTPITNIIEGIGQGVGNVVEQITSIVAGKPKTPPITSTNISTNKSTISAPTNTSATTTPNTTTDYSIWKTIIAPLFNAGKTIWDLIF